MIVNISIRNNIMTDAITEIVKSKINSYICNCVRHFNHSPTIDTETERLIMEYLDEFVVQSTNNDWTTIVEFVKFAKFFTQNAHPLYVGEIKKYFNDIFVALKNYAIEQLLKIEHRIVYVGLVRVVQDDNYDDVTWHICQYVVEEIACYVLCE